MRSGAYSSEELTRAYLRAIAELSFGAMEKGEPVSVVTPYWRMVDPASLLAKRLAGGPAFIRERLAAENRER